MILNRYLALLVHLGLVGLSLPQIVSAANNEIQPTSHTVPTTLPAQSLGNQALGSQVTFAQQPAQVGDRVAQTVNVDLQIHTTITQAEQRANESQTSLKRRQQRFVEVLEVVDGNVRRAHVSYPLSRMTQTHVNSPEEAHLKKTQPKKTLPKNDQPEQEVAQAVEKKSYFVTRAGERLLVTDAEGAIPPQAEFEIVVTSLQNLGLPNPLIQFLLGRTIRVGERLQLPQEIAEQLMGFGEQFGKVEQFELELKSVQQIDGQPCAVFVATIEAVGEPANPIRIRAFGQIVIQTKTCRTVRAELSGPLTLSTAEHTPAGSFQYSARGNMHIAIESQYGHARR